ncbi:methyltransferase domain-containing protein [Aeromonas hydrophila]|uniref:methyltransferase domain-containing protein n=1 Tax=Aeromonas hydrophila TaxID=644 RepID=UPI002B4943E5|nr:methyltransferase domain-containing protein [Aeromonas hydrophila]
MQKKEWAKGVLSEVQFWSSWVRERGGLWPRDFLDRLDPDLPLRGTLHDLVSSCDGTDITILDCGAGPLTILGKKHTNKRIKITAIDALADEYHKFNYPSPPPILTELCETEHILDSFAKNSFDITYARNTLDHSYDPIRCIMNMIEVTRPGGYIYIQHSANEAEHEKYNGMHQWNFCIENGSLYVWNKRERVNICDLIRDLVCVEAISENGSIHVDVIFRKQ